jgi:hypothetical protein
VPGAGSPGSEKCPPADYPPIPSPAARPYRWLSRQRQRLVRSIRTHCSCECILAWVASLPPGRPIGQCRPCVCHQLAFSRHRSQPLPCWVSCFQCPSLYPGCAGPEDTADGDWRRGRGRPERLQARRGFNFVLTSALKLSCAHALGNRPLVIPEAAGSADSRFVIAVFQKSSSLLLALLASRCRMPPPRLRLSHQRPPIASPWLHRGIRPSRRSPLAAGLTPLSLQASTFPRETRLL